MVGFAVKRVIGSGVDIHDWKMDFGCDEEEEGESRGIRKGIYIGRLHTLETSHGTDMSRLKRRLGIWWAMMLAILLMQPLFGSTEGKRGREGMKLRSRPTSDLEKQD